MKHSVNQAYGLVGLSDEQLQTEYDSTELEKLVANKPSKQALTSRLRYNQQEEAQQINAYLAQKYGYEIYKARQLLQNAYILESNKLDLEQREAGAGSTRQEEQVVLKQTTRVNKPKRRHSGTFIIERLTTKNLIDDDFLDDVDQPNETQRLDTEEAELVSKDGGILQQPDLDNPLPDRRGTEMFFKRTTTNR